MIYWFIFVYIGLYTLILVYICSHWLIIGQLIDHCFGWLYQKRICHQLGPYGSKSNNSCGKTSVLSILNFDIFKISGPFWPPGLGPGPRSRILIKKSQKKSYNLHRICFKWAQMGFYQYGSLNYMLNNLFGLIFYYMGPYFNYFT